MAAAQKGCDVRDEDAFLRIREYMPTWAPDATAGVWTMRRTTEVEDREVLIGMDLARGGKSLVIADHGDFVRLIVDGQPEDLSLLSGGPLSDTRERIRQAAEAFFGAPAE